MEPDCGIGVHNAHDWNMQHILWGRGLIEAVVVWSGLSGCFVRFYRFAEQEEIR